MPNIKPERSSVLTEFLSTRSGEAVTVGALGAVAYTAAVSLIGFIISFISQTVYPFSYSFISSPLHSYLPGIAVAPSLLPSLIFGALFTVAVYYFEKNIFYRRFHILLKAAFASVAATAFAFISNLLSYLSDVFSFFLYSVDPDELIWLFIYFYLISIALFALCDTIRRRIFVLP